MRWQGRKESNNVEDRRGRRSGGGIPLKGPGSIVLLLVVLVAGYYGVDLTPLIDQGGYTSQDPNYQPSEQEQEMAQFTSVALQMTEDAWQ